MFVGRVACSRSQGLLCRYLGRPTYRLTGKPFQPSAAFSSEPSFADQRKAHRAKRRATPGKVVASAQPSIAATGMDTTTFNREALGMLRRIEKGLVDMCELNEGMVATLMPRGLTVEIGGKYPGVYTITLDDANHQVSMVSPFTGEYLYDYSADEQAWISTRDQHRIDELMSREMVETAYLRGYPNF